MKSELASAVVAAGAIALLTVAVLLTTGELPYDHSPTFALVVVATGLGLGRWARTQLTRPDRS